VASGTFVMMGPLFVHFILYDYEDHAKEGGLD